MIPGVGVLACACFPPLTRHPQLRCPWRGVHGPAPRCGHCHPDAFPAWSGEPRPRYRPPETPCPVPDPSQLSPGLTRQGRVLTLLDDDSLHLWEIVHHDGCAHLEEALHFQAPSWPGFDGARYQGAWPAVAARCSEGPVKVQWGQEAAPGLGLGVGWCTSAWAWVQRAARWTLWASQVSPWSAGRVCALALPGPRRPWVGEGVSQSLGSGPVPLQ